MSDKLCPHAKWERQCRICSPINPQASEPSQDEQNTEASPIKLAAQIAIQHRRLMDAMTQQGPCEIAAALDNLEGIINKARDDLGLG